MISLNTIVGAFIIITGLVLGRYPDLISLYDLSSESKERNYDLVGLSKMYRNLSIGMGLLIIAIYPIFEFLEISKHTLPASSSIMVIGLFSMYIIGELFYKKRR